MDLFSRHSRLRSEVSSIVRKMQRCIVGNQIVAIMLNDNEIAPIGSGQYFFGKDIARPPLGHDTVIEADHPGKM